MSVNEAPLTRKPSAADKAVAEMKRANTLLRQAYLQHNRAGLKSEQAYFKVLTDNRLELESADATVLKLGKMKRLLKGHQSELEFARQTILRIKEEAASERDRIHRPSVTRLEKAKIRHEKAQGVLNSLTEPD